jgi:phosphatidylglycerophosphate synthase
MESVDKLDIRIRNVALLMIIIGIILLSVWLITLNSSNKTSPLIMSLGLALLMAGILLVTRVQYLIWMKRRI